MFHTNLKRISIIVLIFLFTGTIYSQTHNAFISDGQRLHFPQDKVDLAITKHWQNKSETKPDLARPQLQPDLRLSSRCFGGNGAVSEKQDCITGESGNVLYIGPQADTLYVNSDYEYNGNIIMSGDGVILVDNAKFTLYGHLNQFGNSKVILKNGAYLYVPQLYNAQYMHRLQDNAIFEATNSTVDGKCVYQIQHYDKSQYIARQTHFTHWNFHKVWDQSKFILEDANMVGDLTVNDSCEIVFTRCDTILPWLGAADGDVFDYNFPPWDIVPHYVFDNNLSGIDGINYSVTFDSCRAVMWGIDNWEGSSVKIDSSFISIAFRLKKDASIKNIYDYKFYRNLTFPFDDRTCQITKSQLHMWFPYVYDNAVVHINDCRYAESKAHNQSEIYVTNTISDGFPSCTSPVDSGFLSFSDGVCRTFSSSWHRATLLLMNTRFVPRPKFDASQNVAHGYANFLAVNCTFRPEYEPWAVEAALVIVAAIDSPAVETTGTTVDLTGSAWIDAGPFSSIEFDRYQLCWSLSGDSAWTLIEESTDQIHHAILGAWNTSGLAAGEYDLRLTIRNSAGDSLTAFRAIILKNSTGVDERSIIPEGIALFQNYPNPFNPQTTIGFQLPANANVSLKIYNLQGREVRTLINENHPKGFHSVVWDGMDDSGLPVSSGVYYYQVKSVEGFSQTKKLLLVR